MVIAVDRVLYCYRCIFLGATAPTRLARCPRPLIHGTEAIKWSLPGKPAYLAVSPCISCMDSQAGVRKVHFLCYCEACQRIVPDIPVVIERDVEMSGSRTLRGEASPPLKVAKEDRDTSRGGVHPFPRGSPTKYHPPSFIGRRHDKLTVASTLDVTERSILRILLLGVPAENSFGPSLKIIEL